MYDFGLSSTISTWGNVLTDYYSTKYNKQENELAYKRAIEERDYMNQYNSPKAQQQRLKEAGLNPNLMYGQGSVGQQPSSPQYKPNKASQTTKRIDPIDIAAIAQAKKTEAEAESVQLENYFNKQTMSDRIDIIDSSKMQQSTKVGILNQQFEKYDWYGRKQADLANRLLTQQISMNKFEIELNKFGMSKRDKAIYRIGVKNLIKESLNNRFGDAFRHYNMGSYHDF